MSDRTGAPRRGAPSLLVSLGLLLLLGVIITTFYPTQPVLVVRAQGETKAIIPFKTGDTLLYTYRHSVERTLVEEYIELSPPLFVVTHTRMKSFGAGLPTELGAGFTLQDDWYVLKLNRELPKLAFRTGFTEQSLQINGQYIGYDQFPTGTEIELQMIKRPIIWLRLRRVLE